MVKEPISLSAGKSLGSGGAVQQVNLNSRET
jgi:hypothetical protein